MSARYLLRAVREDALKTGKIVFISGPRQVGKTTLAKSFNPDPSNYFTWDDAAWRRRWVRDPVGSLAQRGTCHPR
jgi:uncharacterized protein